MTGNDDFLFLRVLQRLDWDRWRDFHEKINFKGRDMWCKTCKRQVKPVRLVGGNCPVCGTRLLP